METGRTAAKPEQRKLPMGMEQTSTALESPAHARHVIRRNELEKRGSEHDADHTRGKTDQKARGKHRTELERFLRQIAAKREQAESRAGDEAEKDQLRAPAHALDLWRDGGAERHARHKENLNDRERLRAALEHVRNERDGKGVERHEREVHERADKQQNHEHFVLFDQAKPFQKVFQYAAEMDLGLIEFLMQADERR